MNDSALQKESKNKLFIRGLFSLQIFAIPAIVLLVAMAAGSTYGMNIPYNVVIKEQSGWAESPYSSYEEIPAWIPLSLFGAACIELFFVYVAEQNANRNRENRGIDC